ncbi:MAG: site-specific integrase [Parvibaculum sp.]|uniref:site-specific integrase n=1 Tax=Parvibaculum sp. TaxID=2024848 RepID=UPI0032EEFC00
MAKISKRTIDTLSPVEKDVFIWDDELKNFGLRVSPSGRKTFLVQYRAKGRTRRVKIGVYGALTPDEARQQAKRILGEVAHGEDPAEDIHKDRQAPTVAEVCERFMREHAALRCKESTATEYRRLIEREIKPVFGTRRITAVTRPDIAKLQYEMRERPFLGNRLIALLSKMFNLCELWGLRPDGSNPCRHVSKYREKPRERFLSPEEIATVGEVLDQVQADGSESKAACDAIRLLILTGCRLGEIQTLKWEYVKPPYFILPDSKTGARRIPISKDVEAVLGRIERAPDNPHVLVGYKQGQYLADIRHPWGRIREKAGIGPVRVHDLRHTYASNAIANGVSLEVVGKLLGHTQYQTTMRYAHLADSHLHEAAAHVSKGIGAALSKHNRPDAPSPPGPPKKITSIEQDAEQIMITPGENVIVFPLGATSG